MEKEKKEKKKATVGKKGASMIRKLVFHYNMQNFAANLLMMAAICIIGFAIYTGGKIAYMVSSCTEHTEGHVEMMADEENLILADLENKYPQLKRQYPVIRYDTEKGKYIHKSRSSIAVNNNVQFSAEVRYNPNQEDQALLTIEIFDQIGKTGALLFLGILIFVNSRVLHMPNLKHIVQGFSSENV